MKGSPVLVLLSSALLLCSAAPALKPVTCKGDDVAAAARLAMHHINQNHDHGYKFKLNEVQGSKYEKVDGGCNVELQLELMDTTCHSINPRHFEDCEIRAESDGSLLANCTVLMTVRNSDAQVTRYVCGTRQLYSDLERMMMCPDCPKLMPLSTPEGIQAVHKGVNKFNQNSSNDHFFILQEVGRIKAGYAMRAGMYYAAEFVVVETRCPTSSRITPEACIPLCPDRAQRALCRASHYPKSGDLNLRCEFYPPTNTAALGPGVEEPICESLSPVQLPIGRPRHGSSPTAHCRGLLPNTDPAVHPICPWPLPVQLPLPTQG